MRVHTQNLVRNIQGLRHNIEAARKIIGDLPLIEPEPTLPFGGVV